MPLLLDNIRAEFARFLAEDPTARWRMDAALAHVATIAYQQGLSDGNRVKDLPASAHSAEECSAAFQWLRTEATRDGASEHSGVALDEWYALATGHTSAERGDIAEAAQTLREIATSLRDCHTFDGKWPASEADVKIEFDRITALAGRLESKVPA